MADLSVEEIRNLVKKERESEEEIQRAKDEAGRIVEDAKTEARRIMNDVEDQRYLNALLEAEMKKVKEKKMDVEKQFTAEYEDLQKRGEKNMDKAIALILKLVLGE